LPALVGGAPDVGQVVGRRLVLERQEGKEKEHADTDGDDEERHEEELDHRAARVGSIRGITASFHGGRRGRQMTGR
jgi:hypothetical protein